MPDAADERVESSAVDEPGNADAAGRVDVDAAAALADALAGVDGDPTCARCPKSADYFLYEGDRVETFVCWEHVSPFSAAVDGDGDAPDGRPVALSF